MTAAEVLVAGIVADLDRLRMAYEKAGLLDGRDSAVASRLLGGGESIDRFRRDFLLLGALLRHRVAGLLSDYRGSTRRLRHVAVFGANNVGKSTVVNILAAAAIAEAGPEGGHTRHATAYTTSTDPLFGDDPYAFQGFAPVDGGVMPADRFDCYGRVRIAAWALPQDIVLWDTPDCDAAGSSRYLSGVVEAVGAADLVLYVTTGEHYAVERLVEWVFLLDEAGVPMLECINKTRRRDRLLVIRGQRDRIFPIMAERLGQPAPSVDILPLRYLAEGEDSDLWGPSHPEAAELRDAVVGAIGRADPTVSGRAALEFVARRLDAILVPIRREAEARRSWDGEVRNAVDAFVATYEQGYLTSTSVIEPFSRLNLAILDLLDPNIPGLKEGMALIRRVTRWPARLMLSAGRKLFDAAFKADSDGGPPVAPELRAYSQAHVRLLSTLGQRIDKERAASSHHPFWDALDEQWQQHLAGLDASFAAAVATQMQHTEAEIKSAAADIYQTLRRRPTTLAVLRSARVAANVGGALVGIVLPHHGILYDLLEEAVVAPAMMSATEATTSAIAQAHVARRKGAIVARLRDEARQVCSDLYQEPLRRLADEAMARAGTLGGDEAVLKRLPADLRRLQDLLDA